MQYEQAGTGVHGLSGTGTGVFGESDNGRGGVFHSQSSAQVQLEPRDVPIDTPRTEEVRLSAWQVGPDDARVPAKLPAHGRAGDLLVTTHPLPDEPEKIQGTLWFCSRGSTVDLAAVWREVLMGPEFEGTDTVSGPDTVSEILWPRRVIESTGPAEESAQNVVGDPDGMTYDIVEPGMKATFGEFSGRDYPHLVGLLGVAPPVTHGDVVSRGDIARADVVAFERNGDPSAGGPATGGGWESCDFTFADRVTTLSVSWHGSKDAPRDAHVVANGSIRGSDYTNYFEVTGGAPIGHNEVISFLLFTLPELSTDDPNFTVRVSGRTPMGTPDTPDIDAIGLLPRGD